METPEILKQLRKAKGATQSDIAKLLGFSTTAYQNYERGVNEPSNKSLCILADYYGVTTDCLLGRAPAPDPFAEVGLVAASEQEMLAQYMRFPDNERAFLMKMLVKLAEAAKREAEQEQQKKPSQMVAVQSVDLDERDRLQDADEPEKQESA